MGIVRPRIDWPIAGWRAWYADRSVYDSHGHEWSDLPFDGVVAVKLFYEAFTRSGTRYMHVLSGGDWYWRWGMTGTNHRYGYWVDPPEGVPAPELKRGQWVSDRCYEDIMNEVAKSTWLD